MNNLAVSISEDRLGPDGEKLLARAGGTYGYLESTVFNDEDIVGRS